MLLKEIKPGMVVHCKNDDDKKTLLEEAERLGYKWRNNVSATDCTMFNIAGNTIHFYEHNELVSHRYITWTDKTDGVTEFSDIIRPELTAEEVVPILTEICNRYNGNEDCEGCPLNGLERICNGNECPFTFKDYEQVMEICAKWKSDHEKKDPEIETVDICRIIDIQPDGKKRCVHEEYMGNIPIEEGKVRPSDRNIQKRCREILKRYCMEHDGEFIAVHEVVSRVKAVE